MNFHVKYLIAFKVNNVYMTILNIYTNIDVTYKD